jgi:RNA polymerase sigma-70 factor (ECF subfamily)
VQETFIRLCSQDKAGLDGHAAQWLYTVCRRRALDVRRKERRMSLLSQADAAASRAPDPGPPAVAEGRERSGRLMELLTGLPERQQEVVALKYQGGLSYREIAGVMGTNVDNVGVLMHKAMTTLRRRMGEMDGTA